MIKKKFICAFCSFLLCTLMFASKKSIVCSAFPQYDWILNILGKNNDVFEVTLLQNNGTDLHSFQPSVKDVAVVSVCDMFVYVGGESDYWVEKILNNAKNKNMVVVNLLDVLGDKIKEEEIVEGMQVSDGHDDDGHEHAQHAHDDDEHDEDEDLIEYDEHVWLSLKNASFIVEMLCQKIQKMDAPNADVYRKNADEYNRRILSLDAEYESIVKNAKRKVILFADRFPFRYLADDYNLTYFAAFAGCSAESEASFETIAFLAETINKYNLNSVIVLEKSDTKIADTVISASKQKNLNVLRMDSLQSVTKADIKNGKNYLLVMENNLDVLKKALN